MSIKDYREQIEREVERSGAAEDAGSERARELLLGRSRGSQPGDMVEARVGAPSADSRPTHEIALQSLADPGEAPEVRRLALQILKQQAIGHPEFDAWRPNYLEALRRAVQADDGDLRKAALESLAQHKDRHAQQLLLDGLRDPDRALVPPADALHLLSYDVHAEVRQMAETLADDPPDERTRREALHLLASEPGYSDRFARLFADPGEDSKVRRLAATALSSVDPDAFRDVARGVMSRGGDDLREAAVEAEEEIEDDDEDLRQHTRALLDLVR